MASLHQGHKSIPNFGNNADVGTVGYIVACKTRNCNDAPDVQNDQHSIHDSDYELSDLDDGPGENFDDDPGHGIVDLDRRIANEESDVNDD